MPFDHILLSDCLAADSIFDQYGYSIRATSLVREDNTPDIGHPLLSEASKLFSYELPPAYSRSQPESKAAPVRLAAIPIKNHNVVALMHSVYVPFDTRGRPNSYFTHVIFIPYDQFSWREALKTWGKIQWEINLEEIPEDPAQADFFKTPHWLAYWPPHATQVLPKLDSLPNSCLDDSLLDPLFNPRPDETYWKNLLSHLCHIFKYPEKLSEQSGQENEKEKNAVLGYLLRREAPVQEGEELIGETIRAKDAPPLHPNLGQSMDETFSHLLLAAYLFPDELTRPFGFSTYEPESHGVGIATGRLLAALVKSADEPENDFLKDSLGYFPKPPGNETSNPEAKEPIGHYFADLSPGLLDAFTKFSIPIQQFAKEINFIFQGYEGKEWKTFENSLKLYWRINQAKKKCDYDSTVVLTKPHYWNHSYTRKNFEKLKPKLLLPYAKKCMEGLSQTPQDLEPLKILGNKEFFSWEDVCGCFCTEEFWHGFFKKDKDKEEKGRAFLVYSFFFANLCSHLSPRLKDPLLNSLYSLFSKGFLKDCWKNNEVILEALGDLFTKQNKIDLARVFFETAKQTGSFDLLLKKIEQLNTPQATREEMALGLIQQTLKQGPDNKWLKGKNESRDFMGVQFSRALANLFQTKEQETIRKFFALIKGPGNSGFFTSIMKNLLKDTGVTDKDGPLIRAFLNTEEYLKKEEIYDFLFFHESPESINIVLRLKRVPGWLKPYLEDFLKELNWESFIIPGNVHFGFPFEALLEGLNNAEGECPNFSVLEDGLYLRKSLMDFPNQFNKELFLQTQWASDNKGKKAIIEYLWNKIGPPPQHGYDKNKAERVMDIIRLQNSIKTKMDNIFISYVSINPLWENEDREKKTDGRKVLIIYSLLKYGLIQGVIGLTHKDKLANLFRKNDTLLGNIIPLEADILWTFSHLFRWAFVIIFTVFSSLSFFYPQNSIQAKLAHGFFISTCFLWGCESLFSRLNNLAAKEIGGQKFISTLWALIGIIIGIMGFKFAYSSPPESNIAFAVAEFFWLAIFAGLYKDGTYRLLEK